MGNNKAASERVASGKVANGKVANGKRRRAGFRELELGVLEVWDELDGLDGLDVLFFMGILWMVKRKFREWEFRGISRE
jgi:hypothetical protein